MKKLVALAVVAALSLSALLHQTGPLSLRDGLVLIVGLPLFWSVMTGMFTSTDLPVLRNASLVILASQATLLCVCGVAGFDVPPWSRSNQNLIEGLLVFQVSLSAFIYVLTRLDSLAGESRFFNED